MNKQHLMNLVAAGMLLGSALCANQPDPKKESAACHPNHMQCFRQYDLNYRATYQVKEVKENAKIIVLQNGTRWRINHNHLTIAKTWDNNTTVVIGHNKSPYTPYEYTLCNVETNKTIQVNLFARPSKQYETTIQATHICNRTITLSDGTTWKVSRPIHTNDFFKKWRQGNTILVGEQRYFRPVVKKEATEKKSGMILPWKPCQPRHMLINVDKGMYLSAYKLHNKKEQ